MNNSIPHSIKQVILKKYMDILEKSFNKKKIVLNGIHKNIEINIASRIKI
jgi:hypothetical protein